MIPLIFSERHIKFATSFSISQNSDLEKLTTIVNLSLGVTSVFLYCGLNMEKTKIYHVCLSSHEEVMFRSAADLNMGFNCLAAAVISTDSRLFAEGFLTTHYHYLVQTSSLKELMYRCRYAYTRYFNNKYFRRGRLGEHNYFKLEVEGTYHIQAALNYVLRQGLHHGLAASPFGFEHCSANSFFCKDLGKTLTPPLLRDEFRRRYLPSNIKIPSQYRMSAEGLLLRKDVLDVAWVEQNYITVKNFLFQMNRLPDERDLQAQKEENGRPPITMEAIEAGVPDFVAKEARNFEYGKVNRSKMTDLELCSIIDNNIVPILSKGKEQSSIYLLPEPSKIELFESLWKECRQARWHNHANGPFANKYITESQLRRCLCLPPVSAV